MAFCYFIHGQRGSGKGAFAVHEINKTLRNGNKVATNMTLFLDKLLSEDDYSKVVRLPDIPNGHHLESIGLAYDFDPDDPSTLDPTKEGLLVLDEIKLYLTKQNKEFHTIVDFLVQSRKYGWNILLTGQHKDQAEDVVYKSLTDKLIVCRDETKFKGKFAFIQSLPLLDSSTNKAYIFEGRSELDDLESVVDYDYRPVQHAYSTAQIFSKDELYHVDRFIDMRSIYSYLPPAYLSKHHYIKQHLDKIDEIKNTGVEIMNPSKNTQGMSTAQKVKIGLMLLAMGVFFYFNNPMDNPLIADEKPLPQQPTTSQAQPAHEPPVTTLSQPVVADTKKIDFIQSLFTDYRPRLSAYASSQDFGVTLIIDFYKGSEIQERLVLDDFHVNGYSVTPSGSNAVIVESTDFKHRVTPWPLSVPAHVPAPDIVLTAN